MPSDAAMKLAEKIVEPVEQYLDAGKRVSYSFNGEDFSDKSMAVGVRNAEVSRVAAIIDAGLAEARDAAYESCAQKMGSNAKLAAACRELKGGK